MIKLNLGIFLDFLNAHFKWLLEAMVNQWCLEVRATQFGTTVDLDGRRLRIPPACHCLSLSSNRCKDTFISWCRSFERLVNCLRLGESLQLCPNLPHLLLESQCLVGSSLGFSFSFCAINTVSSLDLFCLPEGRLVFISLLGNTRAFLFRLWPPRCSTTYD